jgi:hypothetical protein
MKKNENEAFFIRHTKSGYKNINKVLKSDNPQGSINFTEQISPDVSSEGTELAEKKAREFFSNLNPRTDVLFFVSSNEARALETADIYRKVSKKAGFEVIKPENTRNPMTEKIDDDELRVIQSLSLNVKNILLNCIFNPGNVLEKIDAQAVDEEIRSKFIEARKIVETNNKKSWGENFYYYSEAVAKIFPELETAKDLYERQFKNLIKLISFGLKKAKDHGMMKNIKILGFGHENYMGFALQKYFQDHNIGNCESINFSLGQDDLINIKFKGSEAAVFNNEIRSKK